MRLFVVYRAISSAVSCVRYRNRNSWNSSHIGVKGDLKFARTQLAPLEVTETNTGYDCSWNNGSNIRAKNRKLVSFYAVYTVCPTSVCFSAQIIKTFRDAKCAGVYNLVCQGTVSDCRQAHPVCAVFIFGFGGYNRKECCAEISPPIPCHFVCALQSRQGLRRLHKTGPKFAHPLLPK